MSQLFPEMVDKKGRLEMGLKLERMSGIRFVKLNIQYNVY